MRNVNANPPPSAHDLHEQIRKVREVLDATTDEHRHEPLRRALRGLHQVVITTALTNAGINDWWTPHGPETARTVHVSYGDPTKGSVYLSDSDGLAPDGTRGYVIGLADPYDGTGEECVLYLTGVLTNFHDAIRVFINTINQHRNTR